MSDKASSDNADVSHHDEKNGVFGADNTKPEEHLAEAGGRRQSVALNVVENPLRVRSSTLGHATSSMILTSFRAVARFRLPSRYQCSSFRREQQHGRPSRLV